uniref:Helicase, lymphoid specific n=2 Tax=Gopherus TaxID=38771 RepID=A0A8C4Y127_9SAUR
MPARNTPSSGGHLGAEMGEQAEAAVITPSMLEEEEQLEAAGMEKEREMLEKARMSWDRDSSEMRYKRLQHLLEKSNIYSKFLLTKMEQQQLEVDVF